VVCCVSLIHTPLPFTTFTTDPFLGGGRGVIGHVADVDDIDNLDHELATFLKKWFPDEVKTKQRYNELMAGVDQYGEVYATQKCVIM
jgi:hypothetical protein